MTLVFFSFIADTNLFLQRITLPRSHCTEAEIILYFIIAIKVIKHEADHAPLFTSEIKNQWLTSPTSFCNVVLMHRDDFTIFVLMCLSYFN